MDEELLTFLITSRCYKHYDFWCQFERKKNLHSELTHHYHKRYSKYYIEGTSKLEFLGKISEEDVHKAYIRGSEDLEYFKPGKCSAKV